MIGLTTFNTLTSLSMEITRDFVSALLDRIITTTDDIHYLNLSDVQLSAFLHALVWHMGGSRETVDDFVVGETDTEGGTLTVYWIGGNTFGALTVERPDAGSNSAPPMRGWLRLVHEVERLDLSAGATMDRVTREINVRPIIRIHFRDGQAVEISADQDDQRQRKHAAEFIERLQALLRGTG
ncbi:hypothetical protein MML61_10140 [Mycobacterium marinum]|uniref:hypothetical protein n=1 Tax=Mycobacterium marinum TaxID=1781 RepID=UPI002359117A|nr:hypothetical protein [Mycobacterium marinum]WCS20131.1 hypothetical protein MML61_10140 [Mycobacterium marinum]